MGVNVTIITASRGDRPVMLAEAVASVADQTVPTAHHVAIDASRSVAEVRNKLIRGADTEWIGFLDDDDVLDPHHVEVLLAHAEFTGADVVIPHCRFDGPPLPKLDCCAGYYNRPFVHADLLKHGIFPITILAKREAVLKVGSFWVEDQWEDWELWKRMFEAGVQFEVKDEVTWTYRRGHEARTAEIQRGRA